MPSAALFSSFREYFGESVLEIGVFILGRYNFKYIIMVFLTVELILHRCAT